MSDNDIKNMKVADLKRELKLRGLPTTGNKTELQDRLQASLIDGELALDDSALQTGIDDDSLDEAVLTDEDILDDSKSLADEHELLHSPTASAKDLPLQKEIESVKISESAISTTTSITEAAAAAPKKVMLKRTSSFAKMEEQQAKEPVSTAKENIVSSLETKKIKMSERNPITVGGEDGEEKKPDGEEATTVNKADTTKILQMSQQERLELRAKKFGGNTVPEPSRPFPTSADLQKMKERAARFGVITSSKISKIEALEKMQQRKQRFSGGGGGGGGGAAATTVPLTSTVTTAADTTSPGITGDALTWEERKRLRLERFNAKAT